MEKIDLKLLHLIDAYEAGETYSRPGEPGFSC